MVKALALSLLWLKFNPWPWELPNAVGINKKILNDNKIKIFLMK